MRYKLYGVILLKFDLLKSDELLGMGCLWYISIRLTNSQIVSSFYNCAI